MKMFKFWLDRANEHALRGDTDMQALAWSNARHALNETEVEQVDKTDMRTILEELGKKYGIAMREMETMTFSEFCAVIDARRARRDDVREPEQAMPGLKKAGAR